MQLRLLLLQKKSSAERNWSAFTEKATFSDSSTIHSNNVNELCHELDENENELKLGIAYLAHGNATSCPADYAIASLVPEMKNLRLLQQENKPEHLAGYIKAVIPPSGTLVVQHVPGSKILDVGTRIFTRKVNDNNYQDIGLISDLFGSIDEPMYAIQLKQKVESEFFNLDSEVFYLHDHPSTRFVSVECDGNGRYTVAYS